MNLYGGHFCPLKLEGLAAITEMTVLRRPGDGAERHGIFAGDTVPTWVQGPLSPQYNRPWTSTVEHEA